VGWGSDGSARGQPDQTFDARAETSSVEVSPTVAPSPFAQAGALVLGARRRRAFGWAPAADL